MSDDSDSQTNAPRKGRLSKIARVTLYTLGILFLLLFFITLSPALFLELPFKLITGWFSFLLRVLPQITWNLSMISSSVAMLVVAALGFHFLARSFCPGWKKAWSLGWITLGGLLFYASISTTGIAHQIAWLTQKPMFSMRHYEHIRYRNTMRHIGLALRIYDSDHAGWPSRIEDLFPDYLEAPLNDQNYWQYKIPGEVPREFLYFPEAYQLAKSMIDQDDQDSANLIALAGPFLSDRRSVLRWDGIVEVISEKEFQELWINQNQKIIALAKQKHSRNQ
ncbi:MAG: hypothetical protein P1U89_17975 [Verrucomicrobiales bacterium]|nr:hypothetical protein [Verrucomicrobiales bacterium]